MENPSGNVGEFSELYVFAKTLVDGALIVVDGCGAETGAVVPVQAGRRDGKDGHVYVQRDTDHLEVRVNEGGVVVSDKASIEALSDALLKEIGERDARKVTNQTFWCPSAAPLMRALGLRSLKAAADAKADLYLEIADPFSSRGTRLAGYTVKSALGGESSLLNAGATVFEYEVSGMPRADFEDISAKGLKNQKLVKRLLADGRLRVNFKSCDTTFSENMCMVDSVFPEIFAAALLHSYTISGRKVPEVFLSAGVIAIARPIVRVRDVERFVVHKAKDFLKQVALGMQPGKKWDGTNEVTGGTIIVRDDGKVVCLCLDRDQDFRDYLYNSSKFDTPSSGRWGVGSLQEGAEGNFVLSLSAQIRLGV